MEIDKYVVILSSQNGGKNHLKISVNRGRKTAQIHLGKPAKKDYSVLYLFGDKMTKQALYREKCDYKVGFQAKDQIDVMLCDGDEIFTGSTGKTPSIQWLKRRMLDEENMAKTERGKSGENAEENAKISLNSASNVFSVVDENITNVSEENCTAKCSGQNDFEKGENIVRSSAGSDETTQEICDCRGSFTRVFQSDESAQPVTAQDVEQSQERSAFSGVNEQADLFQGSEKNHNIDNSKVFSFDAVHFDGSNFYLSVKPQIDEIFVCFPEEEILSNTVPNSKWARVDTSDGHYVVGLIFDGEGVAYICYGVPSERDLSPPKEIFDMAVWLDTDAENGKGYWVIYQDATTGKCLK